VVDRAAALIGSPRRTVPGFLLRRFAAALLLVLLVVTLLFVLLHLAPGDPIGLSEGSRLTAAERAHERHLYGLDRPLPVQYAVWLSAVLLRFDWGTSIAFHRPVSGLVAEALPATLLLAAAALAVEYGLGLALGVAAARRPGGALDHLIRVLTLLVASQPVFWLGLMAILLFSLAWPVLPAGHMHSVGAEYLGPGGRFLDLLIHLALPALVLGVHGSGSIARVARGSLLEALGRESITAARARGLSERRVLWVHALRNAMVPLIQLFALSATALLSGAFVAEVVFSWPGIGTLTFQAITTRDYPVVLATTALAATIVVAASLAADVAHALADPRLRDGLARA
jgi:peptide/nickel transport system permease protein